MGIQSTLGEDEYVVLNLRTHVKALFVAMLVLVVTVVAGVILALMAPEGSAQQGLRWAILGVAVVIILLWSFMPFLRWITSRYTITNRRLITRSGIITRTGRDIPLYRINDVTYEKDLLDRLLGCGTIIISDATDKAGVVLHDVPRVEKVQVQLHELLFAADDGSDDGEFPPTEPRRRR
ncbi:PH domain-containing protein [Sanguibacter gelidistatuariae]|uniref:PH domain-containing protein n=1 Tax=Sanguibacter gelidistatuariae TaxID=1814289 RepID=A0A1G6H0X5_9MICO|nr:PH domain-containing protein [Sanguibacter gelidistatuariae]SDB87922.1 PH domain-containing protein [Sanguibacter gelidistatuariae]